MAVPAIEYVGEERFTQAVNEATGPYVDERTGTVRLENELCWVTGEGR